MNALGPTLLWYGQAGEQGVRWDPQGVREDQQREKAGLALPALQHTDLVAVEVGDFREAFLREIAPLA